MIVFFVYCESPCVPVLISPALFLSWTSRLSRCFLSVDCLWPLVQGMLSPAISPRCINNNSNYSHSNQSVAPASRGLSREQIDRHLKSHIDCVAKKNTHTQTHSGMGVRGDGRTDSEFRRENRCEWVRLVEENKWNCEWSTLYGCLAVSLLISSDYWIPVRAGHILKISFILSGCLETNDCF